jgi:hypothetical protein
MVSESAPSGISHTDKDFVLENTPIKEPNVEVPSQTERAAIFQKELDEGLLRTADNVLKKVGASDAMKITLLQMRTEDPTSLVELRYTKPHVTESGLIRSFALNLWTDVKILQLGVERTTSEVEARELLSPNDFRSKLLRDGYDDKQIALRMQVYGQKYRRLLGERDVQSLNSAAIAYTAPLGEVPDPFSILTGKSVQLSLNEHGVFALNRLSKKESPESTDRTPRYEYVWETVRPIPTGIRKPDLARMIQSEIPNADRGFYQRVGKRIL